MMSHWPPAYPPSWANDGESAAPMSATNQAFVAAIYCSLAVIGALIMWAAIWEEEYIMLIVGVEVIALTATWGARCVESF